MQVEPKFLVSVFFLVFSWNASAGTPYGIKGEAYGMIAGTYLSGLSIAEVCSAYPALRSDVEKTSRNYINANSELYHKVGQRMRKHAIDHGGQPALEKLQREVKEMTSDKAYMLGEARTTASSEKVCVNLLQNLRRGYWDIKQRNQQQLKAIFGD